MNALTFHSSSKSRIEDCKIPQAKRLSSTDTNFPTSAEVVVAGAGAVGASVAYHLTKYGKKDVLVLEQGRLYTQYASLFLLQQNILNHFQH